MGIQVIEIGICSLIIPDFIQDIDESIILLPIDFLKFNQYRWLLLENFGIKEKHTGIIIPKDLPFAILDHGRQLVQIPNKKDLNATKWAHISTYTFQDDINSIQGIRTDHGNFINYQQFQFLQDGATVLG